MATQELPRTVDSSLPEEGAETENWESFNNRLIRFTPRDRTDIQFAYQLAKAAHRGQMRVSQERYFEHLRAVSLIFLDELNTQDPVLVKASLLHDIMEDTSVFGNPKKIPYRTWVPEAEERLSRNFGQETAEIVVKVTKPQVDNDTFHTKEEAKKFYYARLADADAKTLLVKMADRLHNLRTQYDTTLEQQQKKVRETKEIYLPMFLRVTDTYPLEGGYLLQQIEDQLVRVEVNIASHTA